MKQMRYLLIAIWIVLLYFNSFSQTIILSDTSGVVRIANAYIIMQQYATNGLDIKTISEVILYQRISVNSLKSKGFRDIVFFSITTKAKMDTIFVNNFCEKRKEIITSDYNSTYTFGYNTTNNTLYKLLGFKDNDFIELYKSLTDFKAYNLTKNDIKKYRRFIKTFYIEGVDLGCLFKKMKLYNKIYYTCSVGPKSVQLQK